MKYTKYETAPHGGGKYRKPSESKKFKGSRDFHAEFLTGRSMDDEYERFLEKQRKEKTK